MPIRCLMHDSWEPDCNACSSYWKAQPTVSKHSLKLPPATSKDKAVKHDQGKPMMGLIDTDFLNGLARVLTFGAKKYDSHNWRKGMQWSRCYDALQRHMWAWWAGEDNDPESGESHLYHAACCLMFLASFEATKRGEDDRYKNEDIIS